MAWWLRVLILVAFAKDLGSVPRTHTGQLNKYQLTPVLSGLVPLPASKGYSQVHTHPQIKINLHKIITTVLLLESSQQFTLLHIPCHKWEIVDHWSILFSNTVINRKVSTQYLNMFKVLMSHCIDYYGGITICLWLTG